MTVWLGNYPIPDDSAPYVRQRDAILEAIKTYGTDHISGVTVGNEFILKCVFGLIPMSCCGLGRSGEVLTDCGS